MYKIKLVFDSDALIKLVKAGFPKEIFKNFNAYIPNEVYNEVVTKGKYGLFEDAFTIENIINVGLLRKKKSGFDLKIRRLLESTNLGKGEKSALHLFREIKASAIISDDHQFLTFLHKNKMPFITPADLVIRLNKVNLIDYKESVKILEGLKLFIKDEQYKNFKKQLKGE